MPYWVQLYTYRVWVGCGIATSIAWGCGTSSSSLRSQCWRESVVSPQEVDHAITYGRGGDTSALEAPLFLAGLGVNRKEVPFAPAAPAAPADSIRIGLTSEVYHPIETPCAGGYPLL
jgi:hypothetical protein